MQQGEEQDKWNEEAEELTENTFIKLATAKHS